MRTTLDIADDVFLAASELARRENRTTGAVLSDLARQALSQPARPVVTGGPAVEPQEFLGFRPFGRRGGVVTNELINRLREEDAG